jgi:trans-2-enoyl-CoA reductase
MSIFDLEQKIMDCWGVTDDIREMVERSTDSQTAERLNSLADIYNIKFENLFNIFEQHCKDYHAARRTSQIS